jgi:hypothetical protein
MYSRKLGPPSPRRTREGARLTEQCQHSPAEERSDDLPEGPAHERHDPLDNCHRRSSSLSARPGICSAKSRWVTDPA